MKASFLFRLMPCLILTGLSVQVSGQSLPVGSINREDAFRRAQLLGKSDESVSFASRPFFPLQADSMTADNKGKISLMPLVWKQQYNSAHPEGLNDGAMIPARGYQTLLSGGIYARYGWLSIQLMPEWVFAENRDYLGFWEEHNYRWKIYYNAVLDNIDLPERFGETAYQKAFWGQSSVRLTWKSLSLGLSNENLWWGPGMQNALLMTNNAPGFKHITLNTLKPIHTWVGSFEGQLVSGRLDASGYPNMDLDSLVAHEVLYVPKPHDWRYLNGMILSYQPRWVPGLFLGATRSFIAYHQDLNNSWSDYLPVFTPLFTKHLSKKAQAEQYKKDQLSSVFMRWVSPESHLEVYAEYGREEACHDWMDLILEPDVSRAYIFGFRKLTPINKRKREYLDVQLELTQLAKNWSSSLRTDVDSGWYQHAYVRDGYTQQGQSLGAGLGTSGNMQYLSVSWLRDLKRVGIEVKRVGHEENFWVSAFHNLRCHWTDVGGSLFGEWDYRRKWLFNAKVGTTGSINYGFYYNPVPSGPDGELLWWDHGKVKYNIHAELGVTYLF